MLSCRLARTGIGYVGVCGNVPEYSRSVWLSSTGHDSPAGTSPVFAFRVTVSVLPGFGPKMPVKAPNP